VTIRRIGALAIAALALWPAAPAAAKFVPVRSARACGVTGCVPLPPRLLSHELSRFEGGSTGNPGLRLGPFYRLHIRPQPRTAFLFYVPVSRMLVVNGQTLQLGHRGAARLGALLRALEPYPPRVVSVTLGAHRVADAPAYTPLLFGRPVHPPASVWNHRDVLIAIDLAGETPWTGWGSAEYFPSERLLHVPDGVWVPVSDAQAAMIAAGLHPSARAAGGSATGFAVAAAVAVLAAAAAGFALHRRRRPWRRPQAV
jgi:hypothetical protein